MEDNIDKATTNIISGYLANIESAMKISEILSKHSNNNEINDHEVICGLIYRLMVPMSDEEMVSTFKSSSEFVNDVIDNNFEDIDEGESGGEDSGDEEEIFGSQKNKTKLQLNTCNCNICSKVRECVACYEEYQPLDNLSVIFKNAINESIEKHAIYI